MSLKSSVALLLAAAAASVLLLAIGTVSVDAQAAHSITQRVVIGQCPSGVRPRREIRTLTATERDTFIAAVRKMQQGSRPTWFDQYSDKHRSASPYAHGFAPFLPWHRYYLAEFERELQEHDASVMLPYWDWSIDSQAPAASIVFRPDYFGGNGSGPNNCVTDGPFANLQVHYPRAGCLQREFQYGEDGMATFHSPEMVQSLVADATSYNTFRIRMEATAHAIVHNGIGGHMATMHSPNDPIFYLHHAMIDKIYDQWQRAHPDLANAYSGKSRGGTARVSDPIQPWTGVSVRDVLDISKLCYRYEDLKPSDISDGADGQTPAPSTPAPGTPAPDTPAPDTPAPGTPAPGTPAPGTPAPDTPTTPPGNGDDPSGGEEGNEEGNGKNEGKNEGGNGEGKEEEDDATRRSYQPWRNDFKPIKNDDTASTPDAYADPDTPSNGENNTTPSNSSSPTVPVPAKDATIPLTKLRKPYPVDAEWLRHNNLDVAEVRQYEEEYGTKVYEVVNAAPDYVSPCALGNRGDQLAQLVAKGYNTFEATTKATNETVTVTVDANKDDIREVATDVRQAVAEKIEQKEQQTKSEQPQEEQQKQQAANDEAANKVKELINAAATVGVAENSALNLDTAVKEDWVTKWKNGSPWWCKPGEVPAQGDYTSVNPPTNTDGDVVALPLEDGTAVEPKEDAVEPEEKAVEFEEEAVEPSTDNYTVTEPPPTTY